MYPFADVKARNPTLVKTRADGFQRSSRDICATTRQFEHGFDRSEIQLRRCRLRSRTMVYARDSASLKFSSAQGEAVPFSERVAPRPLHVRGRDLSLKVPCRLCLDPQPLRHPSRTHRDSSGLLRELESFASLSVMQFTDLRERQVEGRGMESCSLRSLPPSLESVSWCQPIRFSFLIRLTPSNQLLPYFFPLVDLAFRYGEGWSEAGTPRIILLIISALLFSILK
jgi:hypothetical protein